MMNGRVGMTKGRVSTKMPTLAVVTEEMVGQGKRQVSSLLLKLETPKKYISFR
jgi:hypothetical protein